LRRNERIRISPIRLIDDSDNQLGIVDTSEALAKARKLGMDLVEVAPQAKPPVCRIMDYGKWKYNQQKKEQKAKAHRHDTELKQVRIRTPKIGDHDLEIKVNRARSFLSRGDRVQFTLMFRGRELAHIEEGRKVFQRIAEQLEDIAKVDRHVRREGRRIVITFSPTAHAASANTGARPAASAKPSPAARPAPSAEPSTAARPAPSAEPSAAARPAPSAEPSAAARPAPSAEPSPSAGNA